MTIDDIDIVKVDSEYIYYECLVSGYDGLAKVKANKNDCDKNGNGGFLETFLSGKITKEIWQQLVRR